MSETHMRHVFLQGPRIHMRALEEADLAGPWFQWLNDPEVCRFNSHATFPNTERAMRAFFDATQTATDAVVLAVIWTATGQHIGNVSLQRIGWIDRTAELAILMGDREYWNKGVATE